VTDLLDRRRIGLMCQPKSNKPRSGWLWAADNGCGPLPDGSTRPFDEARWRDWLAGDLPRSGCLFAVVPDVVADAQATLDRFDEYAGYVRDLRYPVGFAAQDGLENLTVPWDRFDCLFIGGSTEWKLGETARSFAAEARSRNKWVHVGRVNSDKRFRSWARAADSCDGTYIAFGPKINTPKLVGWLDDYERTPQLDLSTAARIVAPSL
jgi:hypothetical protein